MEFFFSDHFDFPLPEKHRFPGMKYGMLKQQLVEQRILQAEMLKASPLCSKDDLLLAHSAEFIEKFESGDLNKSEMRRIGFPWSEFYVKRCRATVGGAIASLKSAIEHGLSGQLAGGTHHAHRDFGSGYCTYNDQAVVALRALKEGWANRVAIVDLDVHQGDGTAAILGPHPQCFVMSVHGRKNFPFRKQQSDLDIELEDGVTDQEYLDKLTDGLEAVWAFKPDVVLYQAGVDVLDQDKLGRLEITYDGLFERDTRVLAGARQRGIPVSMAIGGGYSEPIQHSVDGYLTTYRAAKQVFGF
ncbi:MAG: histone deacetylase [Bdellovibrionales bacterium]|nr:histone deacetylase [Bdellovibrionales bacterium]